MNYFIVGDIHGCYFTFKELLDKHWNPEKEKLILLGDFVNKGKHSLAVIEFLMDLQHIMKENMVILKGNNEYLFEKYYRDSIHLVDKQKFENYNLDYVQTLDWISQLPHHWQNGLVYASHAGVPQDAHFPLEEDNLEELFNRKPLKNIGRKQFIGHIVVDEPFYDDKSNAWYLDTGAGFGKKLSAAKVDEQGNVYAIHSLIVNQKDKSH